MPGNVSITINGRPLEVAHTKTILDVCKDNAIDLPTLCHLEGLSDVGACRLCLVQIEGVPKLLPACTTKVADNQTIHTHTEKLQRYRRMIVELFFSERNHVCSICVANGHCDLQELGYKTGMTHVRFPYLFPKCEVDASHPDYIMDHHRCVMCTRCVRVCKEVEGALNWNVMNRGHNVRIISDFNTPWGESTTCTSCGKCVEICPTGALAPKGVSQGQLNKNPDSIIELMRKKKVMAL